jgi:LacI family transcriptional regulator
MATIKDIAQMTNVSTATVSNVLNGKHGAASAEKAKLIFATAEKLHYQPNILAKGLKQRRTNNIGIITEDLTVFNTPEIVDGIDDMCERSGYEIILANMRLYKRYHNDYTDTPKHHQLFDEIIRNMLAKQVAGIIYVGYHCREISYVPMQKNLPFVYAYCFPKDRQYPAVLFHDEKAGYDIASLLIAKGHRQIGVIAGPLVSLNSQARLRGFQQSLFEHGVLYNAALTVTGDWEPESGYRNADALLDKGVSAIFAFNDLMASGVYKRCMERNLAVGKDISLVGYDNLRLDDGYVPPIASVESPLNEMGQKCAEIIIRQISHQDVCPEIVMLPCILHDRASIGIWTEKQEHSTER